MFHSPSPLSLPGTRLISSYAQWMSLGILPREDHSCKQSWCAQSPLPAIAEASEEVLANFESDLQEDRHMFEVSQCCGYFGPLQQRLICGLRR
jgi:hypothetical protein